MKDGARVLISQPDDEIVVRRHLFLPSRTLATALRSCKRLRDAQAEAAKVSSAEQVAGLTIDFDALRRDSALDVDSAADQEEEVQAQAARSLSASIELRAAKAEVVAQVLQARLLGDNDVELALEAGTDIVRHDAFRQGLSRAHRLLCGSASDLLLHQVPSSNIPPAEINALEPLDQIYRFHLERSIVVRTRDFFVAAHLEAGGSGPQGGALGLSQQEQEEVVELGKHGLGMQACISEIVRRRQECLAAEKPTAQASLV